jgi:hypothetical protein
MYFDGHAHFPLTSTISVAGYILDRQVQQSKPRTNWVSHVSLGNKAPTRRWMKTEDKREADEPGSATDR